MSADSVCAFEWRYGSPEMRAIVSRRGFIERMIRVEVALLEALAEAGLAPREAAERLREAASRVHPEEVYERERETGHEVIALVEALAEKAGGEAARWIHYGATSNDIVDTAWALVLRDALRLLLGKLSRLVQRLSQLARETRDVVMIGRTHGQHALPITLGFKLANYVYELARSRERICAAASRAVRAKIGGAVGTMAAWGEAGPRVREAAARRLGLEPHVITTQVAPRDGFAEVAAALAILASQLDRLATEVRELARPEIMEVWEDRAGTLGSSAMPHKANPVTAERISGLARIARSLSTAFLENIVLWHERDLSNSSSERVAIPHLLLTLDQMLEDTLALLGRLRYSPERMRRNLELSHGAVMAEALMGLLIRELGMSRPEAYRLAKKLSEEAASTGRPLHELAASHPALAGRVPPERLREILDPLRYTGSAGWLVEQALGYAERVLRAPCPPLEEG